MHSVLFVHSREHISVRPSAGAMPILGATLVVAIMNGSIWIRACAFSFFLTVVVLTNVTELTRGQGNKYACTLITLLAKFEMIPSQIQE
jgi:hypothetical protein